mmetsp:Transcript_52142/g.62750  ORF Transcript_52142/g.62750 Transcript_52142/m.62750 type:complete len:263 (-) Transcript_52142:181-969(-)
MVYDSRYYNHDFNATHDYFQRQRDRYENVLIKHEKNIEEQLRKRSNDIVKRQTELKRRQKERQSRMKLMEKRKEDERLRLLEDKERRRRCISEKLKKGQETPILYRGSDGRVHRSYLYGNSPFSNYKSNNSFPKEKYLCNSSISSDNFRSLEDECSPKNDTRLTLPLNIDVTRRKKHRHKSLMNVASGVESSLHGEIKEQNKKNVKIVYNGTKYFTFNDAVLFEAPSIDEHESLVWNTVPSRDSQWMESVELDCLCIVRDLE